MDDLIKRITKKTGVTRKQAEGGLVALLRAGREEPVAQGLQAVRRRRPRSGQAAEDRAAAERLEFARRRYRLAVWGRSSPGRWAGLAASFAELGVDIPTAKKFGPIVIDYVAEHGGEDLVEKIRDALKI